MAGNSNKKTTTAANKATSSVDADGFEQLPTIDGEQRYDESEWVEPDEGVVIKGTLERAFVIPDTMGSNGKANAKPFRACYGVVTDDGQRLTFGEKAAFKNAIRELNLGDAIKLEFLGKEALMVNGRPSGKTVWRVKLGVARTTHPGVGVLATLYASHAELVKSGGDLPF